MELRIIFPMLSVLSSGIFHTAVPVSLGEAAAASVSTRLSRPKRCSCATFLDKECVYFCHLDIIWVNTPERTVSYGLGNASRKKRSAQEMSRAAELPRCECAESTDGTCVSFCHTRNPLRRKAARDKVIPTAGGHDCAEKKCKYDLAAKTSGIKRDSERASPSVARATRQLQLLLKIWRMKLSHIAQDWAAENVAS
ncbi:endothelin-1 [Pangasianodon hypophthalmus]|uniref:endothelin-1 n=1 Tax=Pangasianodon hypophthalmus TaxID=310915 RepID=UPI001479CD1F|nr:endothelin-1 [Pangasianodon hypophthalmus]